MKCEWCILYANNNINTIIILIPFSNSIVISTINYIYRVSCAKTNAKKHKYWIIETTFTQVTYVQVYTD